MRVFQAKLPPFLHRFHSSAPLVVGAICVALAISGCASRSELGENSRAAARSSAVIAPADGAQTTSGTSLQKFLWIFTPYRPVIQQGNFVSQEMLAQLKVGMTRDQVRFILGTPLLTDIFHVNRWDYPFRLDKGNGEVTASRVVVFFKDDKVERFDGGNLPTEKEYIARIAGAVPVLPSKDEVTVVPTPQPAR